MQNAGDLNSLDLDFILDFTHQPLDVAASRARFGVWRFFFGSEPPSPPCFWEILRGEPTVYAALERLTDRPDQTVLLREGRLKTVDYLYIRSVDQLCFEAAKWPAYVAGELTQAITERTEGTSRGVDRRTYRVPGLVHLVQFMWIWSQNILKRLYERGLSEEWNVGALRMRPSELLSGAPIENVRWLSNAPGGWVADPMALGEDGKVHVLCEQMNLRSGKGQIAATTYDGGSWSPVVRVIETPTHASYPFLFEHRGEIYCVPETYEANEVALYRAIEFPARWERVATLMSGIPAIDGTLFEHEGLFWLFCTTSENSNAVLKAFYAADILGPWYPHACNPLKVDVRGSRPAGAPFRIDGQLYRPAQDSSRTYGGRVVIHQVLSLSPTSFYEEPYRYVEPLRGTRYGLGLHTISFSGEYCVIDGKRLVRRKTN